MKVETNYFNNITIKGRYLYGYFCLVEYINFFKIEKIPRFLDKQIKLFTKIEMLNEWHEIIEEILPSFILENNYSTGYYEFIDNNNYMCLSNYYKDKSKNFLDLLEDLFAIGYSNLYGLYESEISKKHLERIIYLLEKNKIDLPKIDILIDFIIKNDDGWGDIFDIDNVKSDNADF